MDDFLNKIPNWLRYILAVPIGIVCLYIVYFIGYFSNLYIASPDSLCIEIYKFIYSNCINVLVMISSMNFILPKYQFKFTLVISIIFCSIGFVGLGMNILMQNITVTYIIGLVLTMASFGFSCYHTFKKYPSTNQTKEDLLEINNKYKELANIVIKGLDVDTLDEALKETYEFYREQGIDLKIDENNKEKTLSLLVMKGLETENIDEAISQTTEFYKNENTNQ